MGWFIGFQKNTDKNFLVYHPRWTPAHGWKWIESCSPHVTFNEDVVFGDKQDSIRQQRITSYWTRADSIFSDISSPARIPKTSPPQGPSTHAHQTPQEFEGESQPHSLMESMDGQINSPDCQPPIVPPTSPIEELQLDTLQTKVSESYESPAELSDTDSSIPSSPTISIHSQQESEHSGRQDSAQYPEVPDESTDVPQSRDLIHQPEGQKDSSSQEETPYDYVMTGWDSVQPVAGQKRQHSPEPGMMRTKRGRNVKRTNYYRLHHGMAASESTDPKTWEEAMTCSEATQWRQAANEEFSSLKKKGAIKIISRTD
ncbi:hypothetical protein K3495_g16147, partial [Podosphaera aphanis]